MRRMIRVALFIVAMLTLTCSKAPAESVPVSYTVPTVGADSTTCVAVTSPTPVRSTSLWFMRGAVPASNDSLVARHTTLFVPGVRDTFVVSAPSPRTMRLYVRAENTAGRSCPGNVVTVVFDGVPPAKITDLGQ